jgi:hypothetical protein
LAPQESVNAFHWTLLNLYRRGDTLTILHIVPDGDTGPAPGSIYYCPPVHDPEEERCLVGARRHAGLRLQKPLKAVLTSVATPTLCMYPRLGHSVR